MPTDEELARAYADGDKSAFDELFARYRRPIFSYAYRMVGSRAYAEDLSQEVFLRVHNRIDTFEQGSRFAAWIFTIACNACLDELRRRKRGRWLSFGLAGPEPHAEIDIEGEALNAELRGMVLRELRKLDEKHRQVFLLRTHGNLLFREIADMLNIPLNTVLARYHQVVLALRAALRDTWSTGNRDRPLKESE